MTHKTNKEIVEEFDRMFPEADRNSFEIFRKLDEKAEGQRIAEAMSYNEKRLKLRNWLTQTLEAKDKEADKRVEEVRLEERGLIRHAVKETAKEHNGTTRRILEQVVKALDGVTERETLTKDEA